MKKHRRWRASPFTGVGEMLVHVHVYILIYKLNVQILTFTFKACIVSFTGFIVAMSVFACALGRDRY